MESPEVSRSGTSRLKREQRGREGVMQKERYCQLYYIRASVDALSRDGTDMRGYAQNPKSFQAPRM